MKIIYDVIIVVGENAVMSNVRKDGVQWLFFHHDYGVILQNTKE